MIVFFLRAGFFGRLLLQKVGTEAFIKNRWQRIAKPLFISWPMVFIAIIAVLTWGAMLKNGGKLPEQTPPGPSFMPNDFPLTHLWFLYELLLCYIALLGVRWVMARFEWYAQLQMWTDRIVARLMSFLPELWLALPLTAALLMQSEWYQWFGVPTPDKTLYPNWPSAAAYGVAFALGWVLHRQSALLLALAKRCYWHLAAALICTGACFYITGAGPKLMPADMASMETVVYALCYSVGAWAWTFGLIGLGQRVFSQFSPVRRYLADASYWIYIAHIPLVMALQTVMAEMPMAWWLKLPLMFTIAFAILLLSYHLLVRNSFIGQALNGRKYASLQPAQ